VDAQIQNQIVARDLTTSGITPILEGAFIQSEQNMELVLCFISESLKSPGKDLLH